MTKFALLENVSFSVENPNIENYIKDKITFHDFTGSIDLFKKIHQIFGNKMLDVLNFDYNEKFLIQAFFHENEDTIYDKILLVKREINDNDFYIYTNEKDLLENDIFIHHDVTLNDITTVMLRKYHNYGVFINETGDITDINYTVTYNNTENTGVLVITKSNETSTIKFLDIPSLMKKHEKDNLTSEQFTKLVLDKTNSSGATYFHTQKDFCMGIFNVYSPVYGLEKNIKLSTLLGEDAFGHVYLGLENHLNSDSRILHLNSDLINKILKLVTIKDFKQKNPSFCNIFYELEHLT